MASQWALMWFKLKRHRLAVISGAILAAFYASILISEFLAPYDLHTRDSGFIYAPPQVIHLFDEGRFVGPFVYGFSYRLNMENLRREYAPDQSHGQRNPRAKNNAREHVAAQAVGAKQEKRAALRRTEKMHVALEEAGELVTVAATCSRVLFLARARPVQSTSARMIVMPK